MLRVRELRRHVHEGAATVLRSRHVLDDACKLRAQSFSRLRAATRSRVVPSCPAILRFLLKPRYDERIPGRNPALEARLRHARLRDVREEADGVDAVAI